MPAYTSIEDVAGWRRVRDDVRTDYAEINGDRAVYVVEEVEPPCDGERWAVAVDDDQCDGRVPRTVSRCWNRRQATRVAIRWLRRHAEE